MESLNTFFSFQKLLVWQKSRELVKRVYCVQSAFPQAERFVLTDQLRRAVISVPSNIAEGSAKESPKDQVRFIEIAYGSLMEVFANCSWRKIWDISPVRISKNWLFLFRKLHGCLAGSVETNNLFNLNLLFLKTYNFFKL